MTSDRKYWLNLSGDDLASEMETKITDFYSYLETSGRLENYRRAEAMTYGRDPEDPSMTSHQITHGGEQGEQTRVVANHFRSLNDHTLALITAHRPAMDARPINTDSVSLGQASLANGLLDFYMAERRLEEVASQALAYCIRYGEGWVHEYWDEDEGQLHDVDPLTGAPIYEGDLVAEALRPINVIRDPNMHGLRNHRWLMVRHPRNRYDLAALYPAFGDEILNAPAYGTREKVNVRHHGDSDVCEVYDLYVADSPAVTGGRHVRMVGGAILFDTELGYERIPLIPVVADVCPDEPFGYTTSWDLMSLQEGMNDCFTTALSNHDAFGLQNIWTDKGSDLEINDLGGGLKHWESSSQPKAIQLTEVSEHTYKLLSMFQEHMQTIRGINSVARGNPSANASGAMGALMHALASEYNSSLQRAYGQLLEDMGTTAIRILQQYATIPRLVDIGGYRGAPLQQAFRGDDIRNVRRVKVEVANALLRTTAGRQDIANTLLERGAIQDPRHYLEIISTGRLEPIMGPAERSRRGIEAENQMLLRGESPRVLATDDHAYHMAEHLSLLDEPAIREDDAATRIIMDHINAHNEMWLEVSLKNPGLLVSLGRATHPHSVRQMSPAVGVMGPAPTPSQVPQGPPQAQQAPNPSAGGATPQPNATAPGANVPGQQNTGMPSLPEDPRTGEEYRP